MTPRPAFTPQQWRGAILLVAGSVAGCSIVLAVILFGFNGFGDKNDFRHEMWRSYELLSRGSVAGFWRYHPSYVGALAWRAPFALAAIAFGAGWRVTFFVTAVPCYAAPPLFGLWWASRCSTEEVVPSRLSIEFAAFAVLNPLVWYSGLLGHPEEVVGVCLVVAAVILAAEGRATAAIPTMACGLLNKPGLIEALPVMCVVFPSRYVKPALAASGVAAVLYCVYNLTPLAAELQIPLISVGETVSRGFYPFELLWWFGAKSWLVQREHVLIIPVVVLACVSWNWRLRQRADQRVHVRQTLWLLAFMFLLRTALEPWDNVYYNLPLVFVLFCLEAGSAPRMTTAASLAALILVPANRVLPIPAVAQASLYAVVVVPVLMTIAFRCYRVPSGDGSKRASLVSSELA